MLRTAFIAAAAALVGSAAFAADVITYDPAPQPGAPLGAPPAADWNGSYAGIVGGYGWGQGTGEPDGVLGGVYGGINLQSHPNVVLGVEGDITLTGKSGVAGGDEISNPWNATLRGRAGYAHGFSLIYGTAGVAVGAIKGESGGSSDTETGLGWTAGVGVEHILTETLTGRVEVRHTDLGAETITGVGPVSSKSTDAMLGLGMNF